MGSWWKSSVCGEEGCGESSRKLTKITLAQTGRHDGARALREKQQTVFTPAESGRVARRDCSQEMCHISRMYLVKRINYAKQRRRHWEVGGGHLSWDYKKWIRLKFFKWFEISIFSLPKKITNFKIEQIRNFSLNCCNRWWWCCCCWAFACCLRLGA